jgi:hypothetical protein
MTHDASVALSRLQSWPTLAEADREIRELADFHDAQGAASQASVLRLLSRGLPLASGGPPVEPPPEEPPEPDGSRLADWVKAILVAAAVIALLALAVYLLRLRLQRGPRDRLRERLRQTRPVAQPQPAADHLQDEADYADYRGGTARAQAPPAGREGIMPRVFRRSEPETSAPSWTFEATYQGQGMEYDQTFTLDGADGEYYGECGLGAATPVGVDFERVNALEIWLFDKSDIRTVAKVLMSEKAYHDAGLREELSSRGEPVLAAPGVRFLLEGNSLVAGVEITEVSYLQDEAADNAFGHVALRLDVGRR